MAGWSGGLVQQSNKGQGWKEGAVHHSLPPLLKRGAGPTTHFLPPFCFWFCLVSENTRLDNDTLRKIWDLVERDGSGDLDMEEFALAMVSKILCN